jgi:hypothetical protein
MPEPIIPNFPNIPLSFPAPQADKTKLIVPSIGGVRGKEDLLTSAQKLANTPFKKNNEFNTPYSEVSKEDLARYPNETVFESINTNPSYEDAMRNTQSETERAWNTTKVFGANAASMFTTGLATIPNVIGSVMNNTIGETEFGKEFNLGYDSGVNKSLFEWRDEIEAQNRNYKSDWANNHWIQNLLPFIGDGGFQEAVKSAGYGLGVAAEMYLTGGLSKILGVGTAFAKVANGTAKLGGKIASSIYAVDKMENAVKGIADAASTFSRINPALSTEANILRFAEKVPDAFRLYVGAHGEASFEALEGEQRMKQELGKLYEQKNGRKAEGDDLKLIEKISKKAGQDRYLLNLAVLAVPNYLQVGKLMETFPLGRTAKSFWDDVRPNSVIFDEATRKFGVNTKGFEFKTSSPFWEKGVGKAVKKATEGSVGFLARFPKSTLSISEGFEELGQLYIDELTNSTYKTAFLNKDKSPTLTNWEANKNALSKVFSKEGAESFLMGIIGGVAQQGGTKIFEMLRDDFKGNTKEELAKNQVLAEQLNTLIKDDAPKAFQEYLNSVNANSIGGSAVNKIKSTLATENLSEAQNIAAQGNDQFNYQNLKQQNLFEFISPFVENGKIDVLTSYLEDLKKYKEEDLGEFFGNNTEISSVYSFVDSAISKAKELDKVQKNIAIRYINPYKISPNNEEETTKYVLYENFKKELGHKIWNLSRFNERKNEIASELGQYKDFFKLASESLSEFKTLIDSKITTLKGEIAAINAIPLSGEAGAFNRNLETLKLTQLEALENAKKNLDVKNEEEYVDAVRATFEAFTQETVDDIPDKLQRAFDLGLLDRSIKQTELIYKALDKQSGFETFIKDREAFFSDVTNKKELEKKIEENKDVIKSSNLDDDILNGIVAENNSKDIPEAIAKEQIKQVKKDQVEAVKVNEKANFYEYSGKFWKIIPEKGKEYIQELQADGKVKRPITKILYDKTKITLLPSSTKIVEPIKGVNVYFIADGKGYGRNTNSYENGEFTDKNYYPLKPDGKGYLSKLLFSPINIVPTQSFQTLAELNKALGVSPVEISTQDEWDVELPQADKTKPEFQIHPSILNLRKEGSERGILIYAEAGSGKSDFVSKYSPNVPVIEADDRIVKYLQEKYPLLSFTVEEIERRRKKELESISGIKRISGGKTSYAWRASDGSNVFSYDNVVSKEEVENKINEKYNKQINTLETSGYIGVLTNAGINFSEAESENVKNLLIDVIKENKNSVVLFSNLNVLSKFTTIDLIVNKKNKATLGNVPVYELEEGFVENLLRDGITVNKAKSFTQSKIVTVYHHTKTPIKDFDFNNFQRGKKQISQFGDGLNVSSNSTSFLINRYGNPIEGEIDEKDFIEIDSNKTGKEISILLKKQGFILSENYDDFNESLNINPGDSMVLFTDFQKNNNTVNGVKILNHVLGENNEKIAPFYVIYNAKSFYGKGSLNKKIQETPKVGSGVVDNPALSVESTAKALDEVVNDKNLSDQQKLMKGAEVISSVLEPVLENMPNADKLALAELTGDKTNAIKKNKIAIEYVKAKINNSNPELVKAVESLLFKEQSTSTTQSGIEAKKADIERRREELGLQKVLNIYPPDQSSGYRIKIKGDKYEVLVQFTGKKWDIFPKQKNGKFQATDPETGNALIINKEQGRKLVEKYLPKKLIDLIEQAESIKGIENQQKFEQGKIKEYVDLFRKEWLQERIPIEKELLEFYQSDKFDREKESKERVIKAQQGVIAKYNVELVELYRKEEQAEYAAMSNPNDEAKKKEIYDRYDKLITPLLNKIKKDVTPTQSNEGSILYYGGTDENGKFYDDYKRKAGEEFYFQIVPNADGTAKLIPNTSLQTAKVMLENRNIFDASVVFDKVSYTPTKMFVLEDGIVQKTTDGWEIIKKAVVTIIDEKTNIEKAIQDELNNLINKYSIKPRIKDYVINKNTTERDLQRQFLIGYNMAVSIKKDIDFIYSKYNKNLTPLENTQNLLQSNEEEKGISNVTNLLYEIAPIKAFGTQDPVALVEAYISALKSWELPEVPTFGFDNRENRKAAREWFSTLFKQHQISLINKLKLKFPNNWKQVLAENVEIIREDGGSNASLGNGLQQNGNVQRWTFVINKQFVQDTLGRTYPTDFPFVLHSIKGENGVTYNGQSIIDLPFEKIKDLGINGRITEQKQWDDFVKKYKATINLLNKGVSFSQAFDLEHEVYGFLTKDSEFRKTDYQNVGKEYVYNTYEIDGKNYIVYVINPTDGFSEQSVVYLLDENYNPITDVEAENAIINEISTNTNEVINHQGRQLVSTRMDGGKKLFTSVPLKQKDFSNLSAVIDFLKANEKNPKEEISVDGIYISIQDYKADGGLRFNAPKSLNKPQYEFSISLVPINKQDDVKKTIYISIDKNTKDFQGDLLKKLKDQAIKQKDKKDNSGLKYFTKETKVELLESLKDKNTAGDDLATLPYLVANTLPVQYNVDRWVLIPKTNIVKATPTVQTIPVAQVVEEIEFNAENTGEEIPFVPTINKSTETKEIKSGDILQVYSVDTDNPVAEYILTKEGNQYKMAELSNPSDTLPLKEQLLFDNLSKDDNTMGKWRIKRNSSNKTKEETIEQKVFNLLKNEQGVIYINSLPYWGITNLKGFFMNDKLLDKKLNDLLLGDTSKGKKALNKLIDTGNVDVKYAFTQRTPTTRIEDNNITQRVNNILASCF